MEEGIHKNKQQRRRQYYVLLFFANLMLFGVLILTFDIRSLPTTGRPYDDDDDNDDDGIVSKKKDSNNNTTIAEQDKDVSKNNNATNATLAEKHDVLVNNNNTNNTINNNNTNNNVTVTMIPIISMQRSASTYLSKEVLGEIDCHLSLNEIYDKGEVHSGDAFQKEGKYIRHCRSCPGESLADFVVAVSKRRCHERYVANETLAKFCNWHCYPNFKLHPRHLNFRSAGELWVALIAYNEHAILLERKNVTDEWNSYWFSKKHHYWHGGDLQHHKEQLANATPNIPPPSQKFLNQHSQWYALARDKFYNEINPPSNNTQVVVPVLELTYNETIHTPIEQLRKQLLAFIHS